MVKEKLLKNLGWALCTVLIGVLIAGGFQPAAEKSGVVDLNKVIQQSEYGKKSTADLNTALGSRRGLLEFIATHRVLTTEQAQRLKELTLKVPLTEAEKTEMEKIKGDVIASSKKRDDLTQKTQLTESESALLRDYAQRAQNMATTAERWNQEFNDDLNDLQEAARAATIERAKKALQEVAKNQSFTTIFESTVAPYGVNDLTDATIKAMNAQK